MAMPKADSKLENFVFGLLMVTVMVAFMVTYNIALKEGGLSWEVLATVCKAFWPAALVAFIVENVFVGRLAKRITFKLINPRKLPPIATTIVISSVTVAFMCPIMTLLATILFEFPGWNNILFTWLETFAISFPAALFWNIFYGGPLARWVFGLIFRPKDVDKDLVKVAKDTD